MTAVDRIAHIALAVVELIMQLVDNRAEREKAWALVADGIERRTRNMRSAAQVALDARKKG